MTNFPNLEFPISSADCAEIEALFIELMRARNAAEQAEFGSSNPVSSNPPLSAQDL
jgi:hypothetical protein